MSHKINGIALDKGDKGGSCNVTACQTPESAFYFNKSTKRYYCEQCACAINRANREDCLRIFGVPNLCEEEDKPARRIELVAREEPMAEKHYELPAPQKAYSGIPQKGKKGRDKRW